MAGGATIAQDKEDDPHSRVKVKLEVLTLHDGLPGGGGVSLFSVGGRLGKQTSMRKDSSRKVVYARTIEGQSRWLPDNAIEITLEITENDVKRTETILLEGFEPKTLVLREDPAHGRRELLRLIPVSGSLEPDKYPGVPVEGPGNTEVSGRFMGHEPAMGSNPQETLDPEPGKFQLLSPVLIRDNQVLINMTDSMATATEKDPAAMLYSPGLGRFIFSSVPFEGAIEGKLRFNQISFTLEGKSYLLLTGAPISRSQGVWLVHQPFWRPSAAELGGLGDHPMVGTASLRVLLDSR
jgi:hypothetical protein